MGIESFISEEWSGALLDRLHKNLVLANICNNDYQGDVEHGDRVRINKLNAIGTAAYVPNSSTLTYAQLDAAPIFLDIDRRYSSSVYIEDLDKKQAAGDVVGPATREMAYSIADEMDTYIGTLYTDAQIVAGLGTSAAPIDITSLNTIEYLGLVNQKMDEVNVPLEGRFLTVAPWFFHKMELADITLNTDNVSTLRNGLRGNYMGLDIYVSNNVSIGTASTNADTRMIAGYPGSITLAQQLSSVEALRAEDTFRDLIRALNVYGAKVVDPGATACFRADYTVEP